LRNFIGGIGTWFVGNVKLRGRRLAKQAVVPGSWVLEFFGSGGWSVLAFVRWQGGTAHHQRRTAVHWRPELKADPRRRPEEMVRFRFA
jgi:hypothetical protein